jgi:protein SCO1
VNETEGAPPLWKRYPYVFGFIIGAVLLTILPFAQRAFLSAPPPLADLGPWQLVDQDGRAHGSQELAGKVWIAAFFFTRCPTVCPAEMDKLKRMHRAVEDLGDRVHFVSFTVDPAYDTPDVLKRYALKLEALPSRWTFLTGPQPALEALLVKKMLVPIGPPPPPGASQQELIDIAHSTRFALVDQRGRLRALWPTQDEQQLGNLINAARLLAKEGPDV